MDWWSAHPLGPRSGELLRGHPKGAKPNHEGISEIVNMSGFLHVKTHTSSSGTSLFHQHWGGSQPFRFWTGWALIFTPDCVTSAWNCAPQPYQLLTSMTFKLGNCVTLKRGSEQPFSSARALQLRSRDRRRGGSVPHKPPTVPTGPLESAAHSAFCAPRPPAATAWLQLYPPGSKGPLGGPAKALRCRSTS